MRKVLVRQQTKQDNGNFIPKLLRELHVHTGTYMFKLKLMVETLDVE